MSDLDLQLSSPQLVWDLFPRLIGAVYLISFISLLPQVVPLAGSHGSLPTQVKLHLARVKEAFPLWRRWVHYPTLLWLNQSDTMLRALVVAGVACALVVIYGGPFGFWGLLGCYLIYISLDRAVGLIFPWDCVLFELAFLGLFLPPWSALGDAAATTMPAPLLVWAFRLVVFRVMFGFGKAKFAEATKDDSAYLTGFLANQPLPTKLGWYMHKLPVWALKLSIVVMFLVEIPIPLLVFHPDLGVITALATVGLMIAIQLCGSFGYFSLVMIVACLPLLDTTTPRALDLAGLFAPGAPLVTHAVVALHLFGALLAFPLNTWCAHHWHHWVFIQRAPRWLTFPIDFYRFFHALRWVHPYGVFPPKTQPGVRIVPIIEVSWDNEHWHEIEYPHACTRPESAPRFLAPHHARGDQAVIYDTFGLNSQSLIVGATSPGDPFFFTNYSGAHALLQRILEGRYSPGISTKQGSFDPSGPPPQWARIRTFLMRPTSLEEKRRTGAWWKRAYIGPHIPPVQRQPDFWEHWLPEPEMWHWEMVIWRRRSHLRRLMQRGARCEPATAAVVADVEDLCAADVEHFWQSFMPAVRQYDRNDWSRLRELRHALLEQFGAPRLRKFERILGRLGVMASGRVDPLYLQRGFRPALPAKNYARLWMAVQDVIWEGPEAFQGLLVDPMSLEPRLESMTLEKGLFFTAIFRYDAMVFEAQKLRLIHNFVLSHYDPPPKRAAFEAKARAFAARVTLFPEIYEFLADKLEGAPFDEGYPERYPRYVFQPNGVVALDESSIDTWEPLPAPHAGPAVGGASSG